MFFIIPNKFEEFWKTYAICWPPKIIPQDPQNPQINPRLVTRKNIFQDRRFLSTKIIFQQEKKIERWPGKNTHKHFKNQKKHVCTGPPHPPKNFKIWWLSKVKFKTRLCLSQIVLLCVKELCWKQVNCVHNIYRWNINWILTCARQALESLHTSPMRTGVQLPPWKLAMFC